MKNRLCAAVIATCVSFEMIFALPVNEIDSYQNDTIEYKGNVHVVVKKFWSDGSKRSYSDVQSENSHEIEGKYKEDSLITEKISEKDKKNKDIKVSVDETDDSEKIVFGSSSSIGKAKNQDKSEEKLDVIYSRYYFDNQNNPLVAKNDTENESSSSSKNKGNNASRSDSKDKTISDEDRALEEKIFGGGLSSSRKGTVESSFVEDNDLSLTDDTGVAVSNSGSNFGINYLQNSNPSNQKDVTKVETSSEDTSKGSSSASSQPSKDAVNASSSTSESAGSVSSKEENKNADTEKKNHDSVKDSEGVAESESSTSDKKTSSNAPFEKITLSEDVSIEKKDDNVQVFILPEPDEEPFDTTASGNDKNEKSSSSKEFSSKFTPSEEKTTSSDAVVKPLKDTNLNSGSAKTDENKNQKKDNLAEQIKEDSKNTAKKQAEKAVSDATKSGGKTDESNASKNEKEVTVVREVTPDELELPEEAEKIAVVSSRSVNVKMNQYLDIDYPGENWLYLGEVDEYGCSKPSSLFSYFYYQMNGRNLRFTLYPSKEGIVLLHFCKKDELTSAYIDDYVKVTVTSEVYYGDKHITAPLYAELIPENQLFAVKDETKKTPPKKEEKKPAKEEPKKTAPKKVTKPRTEEKPKAVEKPNKVEVPKRAEVKVPEENRKIEMPKAEEKPKTVFEEPKKEIVIEENIERKRNEMQKTVPPVVNEMPKQPVQEILPPSEPKREVPVEEKPAPSVASISPVDVAVSELLSEAKKSLDAGNPNKALNLIDSYFQKSVSKLDEAWYLKGQIYESNTEMRNIKKAMEAYKVVVNSYPSSKYWQSANERIAYINRFYFNIR